MSSRPSIIRKLVISSALVAGASLGAAGLAAAATGTNGTSASTGSGTAPSSGHSSTAPPSTPAGNPATMTHGPNETLLTGTNLAKAKAAATTAVPGATVIRAETDSSGASTYEVHMKKADGSYVTVELNSNFTFIRTVSGFGAGTTGSPFSGMATASAGA